ncbi:M12 family metallopeptidase [Pseudonocardia hispaniensis]|uniref:M12 family metallopeptidase n=1 Tax=Pseudonocardia hispaniensis TaxID=904933 RepID=A0ABW1J044_9PSEU
MTRPSGDRTWARLRDQAAAAPVRPLPLEEADTIAGRSGVASGVIARAERGPALVEFSLVGDRAIFEGDIVLGAARDLTSALADAAPPAGENVLFAAVVTDPMKRWPGGRVPVELPPRDSVIAEVAASAIAEINARTNAQLVPRTDADADYVTFAVSAYCSSEVGRSGGSQTVDLAPAATVGNAVHELCHVLGLWHEQSREDRDQHIRIHWDRIRPGFEANFRQRITDGDDVGPYDFGSIMHYPRNAFSVDGSSTIEPLVAGVEIGQRTALSDGDIAAVNTLYPRTTPSTPSTPATPAPGNVQYSTDVPARSVVVVMSGGWHPRRRVHWDVVPTAGGTDVPLLNWRLDIGHDTAGDLLYYFTITNLTDAPLGAEVRYVILEEAPG